MRRVLLHYVRCIVRSASPLIIFVLKKAIQMPKAQTDELNSLIIMLRERILRLCGEDDVRLSRSDARSAF